MVYYTERIYDVADDVHLQLERDGLTDAWKQNREFTTQIIEQQQIAIKGFPCASPPVRSSFDNI